MKLNSKHMTIHDKINLKGVIQFQSLRQYVMKRNYETFLKTIFLDKEMSDLIKSLQKLEKIYI